MRKPVHSILVLSYLLGIGSCSLACAIGADPMMDDLPGSQTSNGGTDGASSDSNGETTEMPDESDTSNEDTTQDPSQSTPNSSINCGNGEIDDGEVCDGTKLGGESCLTLGYFGGVLECQSNCAGFDTSRCKSCGNGIIDHATEECDGTDLGSAQTCADVDLGTADQPLLCSSNCRYDYSNCISCGDGEIMPPEQCEPASEANDDRPDLNGETCESQGFEGGVLDCGSGCSFLTTGCFRCGDGVKHESEACEGENFGGLSCADFLGIDGKPWESGKLACDLGCDIDTDGCSRCGDGEITGAEVCDGSLLGGATCQSLGYTTGQISCGANCTVFDTSGCTTCGNGIKEPGEACDKKDLGGETCNSLLGYGDGELGCDAQCRYDTSMCDLNSCGDGIINGSDECDCGMNASCTAAQLGNSTCASLGFDGGTLACNSPSNCEFNTAACFRCGDGIKNGAEKCDGEDLGDETCMSLGWASGDLGCTGTCTFDESECVAPEWQEKCQNLALNFSYGSSKSTTLKVEGTGRISDVQVDLKIRHATVINIETYLDHSGVRVKLLNRPMKPDGTLCNRANIDVVFTSDADTVANQQCSPTSPAIGGEHRPLDNFSKLHDETVAGDWKFTFIDHGYFLADGTVERVCVRYKN